MIVRVFFETCLVLSFVDLEIAENLQYRRTFATTCFAMPDQFGLAAIAREDYPRRSSGGRRQKRAMPGPPFSCSVLLAHTHTLARVRAQLLLFCPNSPLGRQHIYAKARKLESDQESHEYQPLERYNRFLFLDRFGY